jgi:hypothetical protein
MLDICIYIYIYNLIIASLFYVEVLVFGSYVWDFQVSMRDTNTFIDIAALIFSENKFALLLAC